MIFKNKIFCLIITIILMLCASSSFAAITEQQGEDVAAFAKAFIEEGNSRRDENGFPLLTYALSGNWKTCIEIRTKGYNGEMFYVKNNGYYIRNGKYLELGDKWCMDCGTTVLFLLKNTLGLELLNSQGEPWHVQDIYNDAARGKNSQYFEFVYPRVTVGRIDYSKLQKGDVIGYFTSHGNHGMLYLGDGYIAHANRDMIRSYGDNKISGFQVNKLNQYFLSGTSVRVMRIKDGIIPEDLVVNGYVTWPDTGERVDLLHRDEYVLSEVEEFENAIILPEAIVEVNEEPAIVEENAEESVQELLKKSAENKVKESIDNKVVLTQIMSANRPLFYGPYMMIELAKLQNDTIKQLE